MKLRKRALHPLLWIISAWSLFPVLAQGQFVQQGSKLVGSGAVGVAAQGVSVALSGDGNTALVGGSSDNRNTGSVWVFTRNGGVWTQQGPKLVGSGAAGDAIQGSSVALSQDGNTALVGGPYDNREAGAAWVFTRNGGVWTQQGSKLVGSGAVGAAEQGWSVALSQDGNTALVGGRDDNGRAGAAWVFTRNGGVWTQQGSKLVGSGAVGAAEQGWSVALSGDGNTALVGGNAGWVFTRNGGVWAQQGSPLEGSYVALSGDGNTALLGGPGGSYTGGAWVFTRNGGVWTQQGSELVGSGAVGDPMQGCSVALSGDGNTALVGGYVDNDYAGAAWVFTRNGGVWTQQGSKLVGSGAVRGYEGAKQGASVALSGDGKTAVVGGPSDNLDAGAVWVFTQPLTPMVTASPTSLGFTYQPPGPAPSPASVQLSGTSAGLSFAASVTTQNGGNWLSVTPTFGATPSALSVSIAPAGLAAGAYNGTVTVTGTNGAAGSSTITVTLTVASPSATITAVTSAASFEAGIAPNSWITIFGTNLSPKTDTWANAIVNGELPVSLDGVSVSVGGQPAYISYISPAQINALAPNVGSGTVSVTANNSSGASSPVTAVAHTFQPAFFQWGSYAVATRQDFSPAVRDGTLAGLTTAPAKPGGIIILWGTGFGPTAPPAPTGVEVPSGTTYYTTNAVTVAVGGLPATVYGTALSPGYAGLYQVAIQIPTSLANGDYSVVATVSGAQSPPSTLITAQK